MNEEPTIQPMQPEETGEEPKRRAVGPVVVLIMIAIGIVVFWPKKTTWFVVHRYPAGVQEEWRHEAEKNVVWKGPLWQLGNGEFALSPWNADIENEAVVTQCYYVYHEERYTDFFGKLYSGMPSGTPGWHRLFVAKRGDRLLLANYELTQAKNKNILSYVYVDNDDLATILRFVSGIHRRRASSS
jgi:hypothetical protein